MRIGERANSNEGVTVLQVCVVALFALFCVYLVSPASGRESTRLRADLAEIIIQIIIFCKRNIKNMQWNTIFRMYYSRVSSLVFLESVITKFFKRYWNAPFIASSGRRAHCHSSWRNMAFVARNSEEERCYGFYNGKVLVLVLYRCLKLSGSLIITDSPLCSMHSQFTASSR